MYTDKQKILLPIFLNRIAGKKHTFVLYYGGYITLRPRIIGTNDDAYKIDNSEILIVLTFATNQVFHAIGRHDVKESIDTLAKGYGLRVRCDIHTLDEALYGLNISAFSQKYGNVVINSIENCKC